MTEKPKFTVIVDKELNEQIENFMFNNRIRSKSAATVDIIKKGFQKMQEEEEAQKHGSLHVHIGQKRNTEIGK